MRCNVITVMVGLFAVGVLGLTGCVSNSQMLLGSAGDVRRCASSGYGLGGVILANNMMDDCMKNYKGMGYREIENVGAIGLQLSEQKDTDKGLKIVKVFDPALTLVNGINPGDTLISINGVRVNKKEEIVMVYGDIGSTIDIEVLQRGSEKKHSLLRKPYGIAFNIPDLNQKTADSKSQVNNSSRVVH